MDREQVIEQIASAFASVTRDGGVSWSEALAIDDFESEEGRRAARESDLDSHWSEMLAPGNWDPFCGVGGFNFLDPVGRRYYLPAAMTRILQVTPAGDEFNTPPELIIGDVLRQPGCLSTRAESAAVAQFFRYMAEHDWESAREVWRRACEDWQEAIALFTPRTELDSLSSIWQSAPMVDWESEESELRWTVDRRPIIDRDFCLHPERQLEAVLRVTLAALERTDARCRIGGAILEVSAVSESTMRARFTLHGLARGGGNREDRSATGMIVETAASVSRSVHSIKERLLETQHTSRDGAMPEVDELLKRIDSHLT